MTPFTPDQWIMLLLIFLLGLFIGMYAMAGGRWKRRYQEERTRCEAVEAENATLRSEAREMESLRHAADRNPPRDPDPRPL